MMIPVDIYTWLIIDNANTLADKHERLLGLKFSEEFGFLISGVAFSNCEEHGLEFFVEIVFVGTELWWERVEQWLER